MRRLSIIEIDGKEYFLDPRLGQVRNVKNPHDFEDVSPELIEFWIKHDIRKV